MKIYVYYNDNFSCLKFPKFIQFNLKKKRNDVLLSTFKYYFFISIIILK